MEKKTTVLMILDGFGLTDKTEGNAIKMAKTPNIDKIFENYPWAEGQASGLNVGLPDGQMGNSEVGHTNIGAGRIVYQELTRITKSIEDGDFFENPEFLQAVENCKANDSALHFLGLLSDGGVHSHIEHLYGLLEFAKRNGLHKVYVHCFMDGRDTPPRSGLQYIKQLEEKMKELGVGEIATVSGRYYAMDRDNRWERIEKAYDAMVYGKGSSFSSASECMEASYKEDVTDEFIIPSVITKASEPIAKIQENDAIIFYNFRPDRAREITRALVDPEFKGFECPKMKLKYICFTEYDVTIPNKLVAFHAGGLNNTMGEYIASLGLTQLRLAETEKYAHVTFFFNGGVEAPYKGEDRILIPSPKVATYDLKPEMSAEGVTEALVNAIESKKYDLIVINYANPDMVGHTGDIPAAVAAVEYVDGCVGRALDALIKAGGQMFLCADHGNSDKMVDYDTKEPFTAHTTNPVPFVIINCPSCKAVKEGGKLCDISPTLLDMMGIEKPAEMTGHSLLERH
ncbi:2,3-bisphosphoglycerate-independent phosphoglycerate mutase [Anaeropeptidivorans aminofermentans]|uniref:2,3-bisphosphoglycerate-independent phosphoglycerate mutase n=1 Tax=Anaeropeptidivorans aminofermentans TaxID=2934315 RepID=UPI002024895D|nr:2,3-bisphosphoglycerate-independent phosphoglycerate mutase [Anaeropeptidivorans aminofermentans]